MVGTANNTYVAPGITSAASLAAQSGTTNFVTSDAGGHLAVSNFGPSTITNINNNLASLNQSVAGLNANIAGLNQSVASLQNGVQRAFEGTAIAIALGGAPLPWDKNFAVTVNLGHLRGPERRRVHGPVARAPERGAQRRGRRRIPA